MDESNVSYSDSKQYFNSQNKTFMNQDEMDQSHEMILKALQARPPEMRGIKGNMLALHSSHY